MCFKCKTKVRFLLRYVSWFICQNVQRSSSTDSKSVIWVWWLTWCWRIWPSGHSSGGSCHPACAAETQPLPSCPELWPSSTCCRPRFYRCHCGHRSRPGCPEKPQARSNFSFSFFLAHWVGPLSVDKLSRNARSNQGHTRLGAPLGLGGWPLLRSGPVRVGRKLHTFLEARRAAVCISRALFNQVDRFGQETDWCVSGYTAYRSVTVCYFTQSSHGNKT